MVRFRHPALAGAPIALTLALAPVSAQPFASGPGQGPGATGSPRHLVVGGAEGYASVQAAVDAASAGDTVTVRPGVYAEHVVVDRPIVLVGEPGAVLDGGGTGVVLTVTAAASISGLAIRGSGRDLSAEDAGVLGLGADGVEIRGLHLEDVLFGIYLKESRDARVLDNVVVGKDLPVAERGDGVRLWYCQGGVVSGNRLRRVRDLVIWFSSGFEILGNVVEDSRYGVHYMYSDHNRFEGNRFERNHVGAFLMYSSNIRFARNVFADARGASGVGLGLKDADDIEAEDNVFVGNSVAITLDNAPTSIGVVNVFRRNLIAHNDVGISLLPSVHSNRFETNAFVDNLIPVAVSGGGNALANVWRGNRWSGYAGFDDDGDGVGDTPYRFDRIADELYARHPELRLFALSPAADALELLGRLFPLLKPAPVVIDSAPALSWSPAGLPAAGATRAPSASASRPSAPNRPGTAAMLMAAAIGALALAVVAARPPRWSS